MPGRILGKMVRRRLEERESGNFELGCFSLGYETER